jgi:hypothetical protein
MGSYDNHTRIIWNSSLTNQHPSTTESFITSAVEIVLSNMDHFIHNSSIPYYKLSAEGIFGKASGGWEGG